MKVKENRAERYFKQKNFSIFEFILLAFIFVSAFISAFIPGGGPVGMPVLLISGIVFAIYRSRKVKGGKIDEIIAKIISENGIEITENTLTGYELKNSLVKKREDGKAISPNYYITNIVFEDSEEIIFNVHMIDVIALSVTENSYRANGSGNVSLVEEKINTPIGVKNSTYLKIECCDYLIPIDITDYKTLQFVEEICNG